MTEPEDFLSRWARRKRDARSETETKARADTGSEDQPNRDQVGAADKAEQDATARQPTPAPTRDAKPEDAFDLSKLPSLDSIGPTTDIRVFLQPGVPDALSRAALRRAWSADPGIRDFIGLAENSWDFTAGDGMHGFGALDPEDAKRLLAQLFSESDRRDVADKDNPEQDGLKGEGTSVAASPENGLIDSKAPGDDASNPDSANHDEIASEPAPTTDGDMQPTADTERQQSQHRATSSAALQQETAFAAPQQQAEPARAPARGHGRALPR